MSKLTGTLTFIEQLAVHIDPHVPKNDVIGYGVSVKMDRTGVGIEDRPKLVPGQRVRITVEEKE